MTSDVFFSFVVERLPKQLASSMAQNCLLSPVFLRYYPRKSAEELGLAPAQVVKMRKVVEGNITAIGFLFLLGMVVSYPFRRLMTDRWSVWESSAAAQAGARSTLESHSDGAVPLPQSLCVSLVDSGASHDNDNSTPAPPALPLINRSLPSLSSFLHATPSAFQSASLHESSTFPLPQIQRQMVKVVKIIPQELVLERFVEQIVVQAVLQICECRPWPPSSTALLRVFC